MPIHRLPSSRNPQPRAFTRLCSTGRSGYGDLVRPLGFRFDVNAVLVEGVAHRAECRRLPMPVPADALSVARGGCVALSAAPTNVPSAALRLRRCSASSWNGRPPGSSPEQARACAVRRFPARDCSPVVTARALAQRYDSMRNRGPDRRCRPGARRLRILLEPEQRLERVQQAEHDACVRQLRAQPWRP